jgi:hypothetical protein
MSQRTPSVRDADEGLLKIAAMRAKEGSFTGQAQSSEHQRTAGWSEQGLV